MKTIRLKTAYTNKSLSGSTVHEAGETLTTDDEKADQLVKLGRAAYMTTAKKPRKYKTRKMEAER